MSFLNFWTKKNKLSLNVTLWPSFEHFRRFSRDNRIQGIRLNSAMMDAAEINKDFCNLCDSSQVPLWFDVKGMQLRIREIVCDHTNDHLEFILNRPIEVNKKPFTVYFKAGEDGAKCVEVKNGKHLIFEGGPKYEVRAGESIHIKVPYRSSGPVFLDYEKEKIDKVKSLGLSNYYLSYVWDQKHVDEFREVVGKNSELRLKIENLDGLNWVASKWKSQSGVHLVAARGDLYVEISAPHKILEACKLIISRDKDATVGSRMFLSVVPPKQKIIEFLYQAERYGIFDKYPVTKDHLHKTGNIFVKQNSCSLVPRCADFSDLAWLYDIGYRNFLLCDELCLEEKWLAPCVNMFDSFRKDYAEV